MDALADGPGRAIDIGFCLGYQLGRAWRLGLEYRALEGGADIEDVVNFALISSDLLALTSRPLHIATQT